MAKSKTTAPDVQTAIVDGEPAAEPTVIATTIALDADERAVILWPDTVAVIKAVDFGAEICVSGIVYSHVDEVEGLWRYRRA